MKFKYETHVHTKEGSRCGKDSAREIVRAYAKAGYAGLVITNHFIHGNTAVPKELDWSTRMQMYYNAYLEAKAEGEKLDFDVLFGFEHHYGNGKEILVYGVDFEFLQFHPELETADIDTFARLMHEAGGFLVHAHPYRQRASIPNGYSPRIDVCDGVEVYNTHDVWGRNQMALDDAIYQRKYCFSGGDTHYKEDERIGNAGLVFNKRIRTTKEFVDTIRENEYGVLIEGKEYSLERVKTLGTKMSPAVFVVNETYQIMLYVTEPCVMWMQIGDKCFYDASNGILRSDTVVHRVEVPMEMLDYAREYTVYIRKMSDGNVESCTYAFSPVQSKEGVRAYHISDAHGWIEGALQSAAKYENIDFLMLNGDISNSCESARDCSSIYRIASALTGGRIPIVFARGNHDMRGRFAERFHEVTPTDCGNFYYTFRLGNIWGLVLDCGENKEDDNEMYGGRCCSHALREEQTRFIKQVISRSHEEYQDKTVRHRVIICHYPFSICHYIRGEMYNIEHDIYKEWTGLMNAHVQPDIMLSGHTHHAGIVHKGDAQDLHGMDCPVVIGAEVKKKEPKHFAGAVLKFAEEGIRVEFTDCLGEVGLNTEYILRRKQL